MIFIDISIGWEGILLLLLILILFVIALLHFYWALGGKWGLEKSIPSKEDGTLLFVPTPFQCAIVGFGLLAIMLFIFLSALQLFFPSWVFKYSFLTLGGIFTLRAIGDFNYVGFFKKVKNTTFGKLDSKIFSPLCLLFGATFFWMASTI